jgi:type IV pilus assembly protein PilW
MRSVTCAIAAWCTATGQRTAQAGFSLIELMVALTIAMVLLMGLALLFNNTSVARGELDKASRQIESGRYAMQEISDDVRHAGYYGALNNAPTLPGSVASLPDPCSTTLSVVQNSLAIPLQGYVGAATAAALDSGNLGCLNAAAGYKANTAVLVVRRADTSIAASAATTGWFNIQVSGCAGDPAPYLLDVPTGTFNLHTNTAPGCLPLTGANAATITPIYTRIYFISTCSGTDCSAAGADSVPTLKRIDVTPAGTANCPSPLSGTPPCITPIVDGIENLQFDYGIDNSAAPGDGIPHVYTNTPAHAAFTPSFPVEWQNVMSLRIYLLARNLDATGGYTDAKTYALGPVSVAAPGDAFRRHAYSQLVRLNNPAGRRE